jgi:hypothetical protein
MEDIMNDFFTWCVIIAVIAVLTAGIVLIGGILEGPAPVGQTTFRGRPLRAWLEDAASMDTTTRQDAFDALDRMGPENREAVPELVQALQSGNSLVRAAAARALGRIGPAAREAIPALEEAAQNGERADLREIIDARGRIEGREGRGLLPKGEGQSP